MTMTTRWRRCDRRALLLAVLGLPPCLGCTPAAFFNNTVTLGGTVPGRRGSIDVMFVNETAYRAVFTFGTYDPLNTIQNTDVSFPIAFDQLYVDADATNRLDAFTSSQVFEFSCGRALSVGGEQLAQLIEENRTLLEEAGATIRDEALRPVRNPDTGAAQAGVAFSGEALDAAGAGTSTAGWAEETVTLQGWEYQCGSLLVYTFVQDNSQPGGFRTDLTVILP